MEATPLFPEAPQDDDDDSESALAKKRAKKFELKENKDDEQPKRISLENLFVREKIEEEPKKNLEDVFNPETLEANDKEEQSDTTESSDEVIEQLADDEIQYTVESIAEERTNSLQEELEQAEPGSSQEAEIVAGAAFVENLLDHVKDGEPIDESVMDAALAEAITDITGEMAGESSTAEASIEDSADEEDNSSATIASSSTGSVAGGSGSGSGGAPPTPPAASGGIGMPPPPRPPQAIGMSGGGPSIPSGAVGPPTASYETSHDHTDNHSHVKYVLAGGIVGYLVGRRRGRIKTEATLLPIQKKLESQVGTLAEQIEDRERSIRNLAREQYARHTFDTPRVVETLNAKNEKRAERAKQSPPLTPEQTVTLNREAPASSTNPETKRFTVDRSEKKVETMLLADLLLVAQGIEINGQSVKSIFEAGKIDAPALRRIIKEFMSNGDYKKELMQSMRPEEFGESNEILSQKHESEKQYEQKEPQNESQSLQPIDELVQQRYAHLQGTNDSPQLNTYNKDTQSASGTDIKRQLMMAAGSVVAVIILALLVGTLLLQIL